VEPKIKIPFTPPEIRWFTSFESPSVSKVSLSIKGVTIGTMIPLTGFGNDVLCIVSILKLIKLFKMPVQEKRIYR
jgi:hypothetical protein